MPPKREREKDEATTHSEDVKAIKSESAEGLLPPVSISGTSPPSVTNNELSQFLKELDKVDLSVPYYYRSKGASLAIPMQESQDFDSIVTHNYFKIAHSFPSVKKLDLKNSVFSVSNATKYIIQTSDNFKRLFLSENEAGKKALENTLTALLSTHQYHFTVAIADIAVSLFTEKTTDITAVATFHDFCLKLVKNRVCGNYLNTNFWLQAKPIFDSFSEKQLYELMRLSIETNRTAGFCCLFNSNQDYFKKIVLYIYSIQEPQDNKLRFNYVNTKEKDELIAQIKLSLDELSTIETLLSFSGITSSHSTPSFNPLPQTHSTPADNTHSPNNLSQSSVPLPQPRPTPSENSHLHHNFSQPNVPLQLFHSIQSALSAPISIRNQRSTISQPAFFLPVYLVAPISSPSQQTHSQAHYQGQSGASFFRHSQTTNSSHHIGSFDIKPQLGSPHNQAQNAELEQNRKQP